MSTSLFTTLVSHDPSLSAPLTRVSLQNIWQQCYTYIEKHQLPVTCYLGVQRFSNTLPYLAQYAQLSAFGVHIIVFGVADIDVKPVFGVTYAPISPNSPLAHEWFALIDSPTFWITLVAGPNVMPTSPRLSDPSVGIWSDDVDTIDRAVHHLIPMLGHTPHSAHERNNAEHLRARTFLTQAYAHDFEQHIRSNHQTTQYLMLLHQLIDALNDPAPITVQHIPTHLFTMMIDLLTTGLCATEVAITLHNHDGSYLVVATHGCDPAIVTLPHPGPSPSSQALNEGNVVHVVDALQSHRPDPLLQDARSILAAPLLGKEQPYGTITIGHPYPEQFTSTDGKMLKILTTLLGTYIDQHQVSSAKSAPPLLAEQSVNTLYV
ncbi:MAG: GAF domain-containing protein [Chloroflexota bacterium]